MTHPRLLKILLLLTFCFPIKTLTAKEEVAKGHINALSSVKASLEKLDSLVYKYKGNDFQRALHYASNALSIATRSGDSADLVKANILMGMAYFQNEKDTSYFYYNEALKIANKEKMVKEKIPVLYNLAVFYIDASDFQTAINHLETTINLAQSTRDFENVSNCYNMLGGIKKNVGNFNGARILFDSAFQIAKENGLYKQMGVAKANIAQEISDPSLSIPLFQEALKYLEKSTNSEEERAAVYNSMGLHAESLGLQIVYFKNAIKLATRANDPRLVISACNNIACTYLEMKDLKNADYYIKEKAIPIALKHKDNDWLSTLYDSYADVCFAKGAVGEAYQYLRMALAERDTATTRQAGSQVRLLTSLMDLKNKEIIIQNRGKEVLIQKNRATKMKLLFTIAAFATLVLIFLVFLLQQRSKRRLDKEQIESARRLITMEESEKERTARELHDITGQLVMGITGEIENLDIPEDENKEMLQQKIKLLGKSIRQISHRMNPAMIEHFTFEELITGQCEDVQRLSKIPVHLEIDPVFPDFPKELVLHFYRIVQELLTNATKYASHGTVSIRVKTESNKLKLLYSDTGSGFELNEKTRGGMGIMNIFERTKLIGGTALLNSEPGEGTKWEITVPIN
ncbi:MAG: ATP-binding protein [Bacteroidota bacterium]